MRPPRRGLFSFPMPKTCPDPTSPGFEVFSPQAFEFWNRSPLLIRRSRSAAYRPLSRLNRFLGVRGEFATSPPPFRGFFYGDFFGPGEGPFLGVVGTPSFFPATLFSPFFVSTGTRSPLSSPVSWSNPFSHPPYRFANLRRTMGIWGSLLTPFRASRGRPLF